MIYLWLPLFPLLNQSIQTDFYQHIPLLFLSISLLIILSITLEAWDINLIVLWSSQRIYITYLYFIVISIFYLFWYIFIFANSLSLFYVSLLSPECVINVWEHVLG